MLKINNEFIKTPESSYVSGWFNEKLFEFHYYYDTKEFHFGTTPLIDGRYISCEPLSDSEQDTIKEMWLTGKYRV
jgi:hypothetical protein